MFLNFAQLLSFELSKEITVIFAITYMLFCNLYFLLNFYVKIELFFSRMPSPFSHFSIFFNYDRYFFNKHFMQIRTNYQIFITIYFEFVLLFTVDVWFRVLKNVL